MVESAREGTHLAVTIEAFNTSPSQHMRYRFADLYEPLDGLYNTLAGWPRNTKHTSSPALYLPGR